MAEINLDGQSIFVDVSNEPQLPTLYSQLLGDDGSDLCSIRPERETLDQPPQTETVQSQQNDDIEVTKKKRLWCSVCESYSCYTKEQLLKHKMLRHGPENMVTDTVINRLWCYVCQTYACRTEEQLTIHLRGHRGENRHQCDICDYSTPNSVVFREHINVHKGLKPHKCTFCDYRCASKSNLAKHELRKHHTKNPLKCPFCSFFAENPQSLDVHTKENHQKLEERICKICNRTFSNALKRKDHIAHWKKCKLCAFVACSRSVYNKHLKQDHCVKETVSGHEEKTKSNSIKRIFKCALCPWSSDNTKRILLHLIHHPNQIVNEDFVDIAVLRKCGIMN